MRLHIAVLAGAVAVAAAACSPAPSQTPTPAAQDHTPAPIPVIVDTDLDASDIVALLVLLRDPNLDVRAITIALTGTGVKTCAAGSAVAEYVLGAVGATDVPIACGRSDAGEDGNPVPDAWRAAAEAGFGLPIEASGTSDTPGDAATLLASAVDESPSAPTLVALGPWTNLEDAITADDTLPDRLAAIHAMAGTIDAPGNVLVNGLTEDSGLEWNIAADPSAAAMVLGTDVPITLVPLDATDDVPVPSDLADRLATNPSGPATAVAQQLLSGHPDRVGAGQQLWDELAALTVTNPDLASWEDLLLVVTPDGPEAGRLRRDEAGRPVTVALSADRDAVIDALVEALHAGGAAAS